MPTENLVHEIGSSPELAEDFAVELIELCVASWFTLAASGRNGFLELTRLEASEFLSELQKKSQASSWKIRVGSICTESI